MTEYRPRVHAPQRIAAAPSISCRNDPSVAELLRLAFPASSENALCEAAARALGCAPNTVRAALRGAARPSWPLVRAAARVAQARGHDPARVLGL